MDSQDLEAKAKEIEQKFRQQMSKPQVGIRLDILRKIMDEIDLNENLIQIFGEPVSSKLGIISDVNDLKIVDAKIIEITKEQEQVFVSELEGILKTNIEKFRDI